MTQNEESFLSHIIDLKSIRKDKMNLIKAPCGSGKTTLALETLPESYCVPGRTLYLIDTLAGMEQLLKNEVCQCYDSEILDPNSYFQSDRPPKITVITYAKFGALCCYFPDWYFYLDTIICDEIHKLPEMMHWEEDEDAKYYEAAWTALLTCSESASLPTIIAMTATPAPVYQKLDGFLRISKEKGYAEWYSPKVNPVTVNGKPKRYRPQQVEHYQNLTMLCNRLPLDKKGIIYIPRIAMIKQYAERLEKRGLRTAVIWSVHNKAHPMSSEQLAVRNSIICNAAIPDDIDVLFINKSCETSISIKSHIDYMVLHTTESDTKLQAMGRYRGNLELIYIYWPSEQEKIELPEEMLDIPLFKEDLDRYIRENNIRNAKGELMKTPSFLQLMKKQGYTVVPGKIRGGKRYNRISSPV